MKFKEIKLETVLPLLDRLKSDTKPLWGNMSAQRMVEHISDTFDLAMGRKETSLEIPADKVEKAQQFIFSEHPMPRNFEASFAGKDVKLRNDEIELAIDELTEKWLEFEDFFEEHPGLETLHPNFGKLDYEKWKRLNKKHLTHHLQQFGLM